jgi:hypothetical protein
MRVQSIILIIIFFSLTACRAQAPAAEPSNASVENASQAAVESTNSDTSAAADASDIDTASIVKQVMAEQYGSQYNEAHQCWQYTADNALYCMKSLEPSVVNTVSGNKLYFQAVNRTDIADNPDFSYGHSAAGVMGAFVLSIDSSGAWTYSASNKEMLFGSSGYCGCDKATLVKLNAKGDHAWLFSNGGVWQGIEVFNHALVAVDGNTFINISAIPQIREEDQGTEYSVAVVSDDSAKPMYPLRVTKTSKDKSTSEKIIEFDSQKKTYALPAGF